MNFLKLLFQKLFGTANGAKKYYGTQTAVNSAISDPVISTLLEAVGVPTTPQAAADLVAGKLAGKRGLTDAERLLLQAYVAHQNPNSQNPGG